MPPLTHLAQSIRAVAFARNPFAVPPGAAPGSNATGRFATTNPAAVF